MAGDAALRAGAARGRYSDRASPPSLRRRASDSARARHRRPLSLRNPNGLRRERARLRHRDDRHRREQTVPTMSVVRKSRTCGMGITRRRTSASTSATTSVRCPCPCRRQCRCLARHQPDRRCRGFDPSSVAPLSTTIDRSDPSTAPTMIACLAPAVGSSDDRPDRLPVSHAGNTGPPCALPARHSRKQSCSVTGADHRRLPHFRRISERRHVCENMPLHELGRSIPECILSRAERSGIATHGQHKSQLVFLCKRAIGNSRVLRQTRPNSRIPGLTKHPAPPKWLGGNAFLRIIGPVLRPEGACTRHTRLTDGAGL